ncbi:hypothetical protein PY257_00750 [Ramlibacter sp. H39-3-26]|nr:hypothetical protein [Ramlibacter sp. H39-3-26]MDF1483734.1 hypothetical protein [Ramlibacter sp. H39-3-26]
MAAWTPLPSALICAWMSSDGMSLAAVHVSVLAWASDMPASTTIINKACKNARMRMAFSPMEALCSNGMQGVKGSGACTGIKVCAGGSCGGTCRAACAWLLHAMKM